jgi:hypothetical protein
MDCAESAGGLQMRHAHLFPIPALLRRILEYVLAFAAALLCSYLILHL